ncbi:MAG: hypothetical protein KDD44_08830, partial [Bdellovibrionales bacterium]|nr:hypothetical protein [Bdellovibrionales bacterium]
GSTQEKGMKRPGLLDLCGVLVTAVLVGAPRSLAGDPGLGWHLATGEWVVRHFDVPRIDPFLASTGDSATRAWVASQWLSDVIFYGVLHVGGWGLLYFLTCAVVFCAYFFVLTPLLKDQATSALLSFFALLLTLIEASIQWFTRPVIFSFLLFAMNYRLARGFRHDSEDAESCRRYYWAVPLLFLLWANLHPAFPLGLAVWGLLALELSLRRRLAQAAMTGVLAGLALLATLVNPYGVGLHRAVMALTSSDYFMRLNVEWLPPEFSVSVFGVFLLALAVFFLAVVAGGVRGLTAFDVFSLLLFGSLSLLHRRYIPFFSVVSLVPLATVLERIALGIPLPQTLRSAATALSFKEQRSTTIGWSAVIWLVALAATLGRFGPISTSQRALRPTEYFPSAAVSALAAEFRPGERVLSTPDWGGYLTYRLWPRAQALIDDRNALLGEELYRQYFRVEQLRPGWRTELSAFAPDWVLIRNTAPLVSVLVRLSDWEERYRDDTSVLFQRRLSPQ